MEVWTPDRAAALLSEMRHMDGALLPILHKFQDVFGYIPPESIDLIADALNQTAAEIEGVLSFYHDFKRAKPDLPVVRICVAESCAVTGAAAVQAELEDQAGFVTEPVYCLGNCALSPAVEVKKRLLGKVHPDRVLADVRAVLS